MTVDALRPVTSIFEAIGGQAAVDRLVESFYRSMDARSEARAIRAMHASDLGPTKAVFKLYLAEWLGGPKRYSEQRGHPRLRMRHFGFAIGPAERDAWMSCMSAALEEVIDDVSLRERLRQNFAKLADWVRNDPDNEHDKHR